MKSSALVLLPTPYPLHLPLRHKKCKERKEKYSPSDAVAANNGESRDAIVMTALPNTAALQQDTESSTSPVVTTGPSTTTASPIVSEATTITAPPPPPSTTTGETGKASAAVDPFHLSEGQIKLSRGLF